MPDFAAVFSTALDAVDAATRALPTTLPPVRALDDTALLAVQRRIADSRRALDACASLVAGEVAYRSRRDLGYPGLAQREGFRTPEKLIQDTTGATAREATTLVAVGTMVHEAMLEPVTDPNTGEIPPAVAVAEPWLTEVGTAVTAGTLSVEAAKAIKTGLGEPATAVDEFGMVTGVSVDDLKSAAARLIGEAAEVNADQVFKLARQLRDELDADGIAAREKAMYEQRAFRRIRRPNGQPRYILDPDLETGALLDDLYDSLRSPRRGGPRFTDPTDQAWAQHIIDDPRTDDQYLHDAITGLLRLGIDTDQAERTSPEGTPAPRITGSRPPAVRVLATEASLNAHTGKGRIEGTDIPVSIQTVERIICTAGTIPIAFSDEDQVLALGRELRLFTGKQRLALAARDGGCMWPGCDRPPTWTEAHHITPWASGGNTDLDDGILLCRHHHLLLHNNHWEIIRNGTTYWLIPPTDIDPTQTPRPLPTKSAALHDLRRQRKREQERDREEEHAPRDGGEPRPRPRQLADAMS